MSDTQMFFFTFQPWEASVLWLIIVCRTRDVVVLCFICCMTMCYSIKSGNSPSLHTTHTVNCWTENMIFMLDWAKKNRTLTDENFSTTKQEKTYYNFIVQNFLSFSVLQSRGDKGESLSAVSHSYFISPSFFFFLSVCPSSCFLFTRSASVQKRKSSSLLDARMAKIYRGQRHSQEGDESASDDDDDGEPILIFFI